MYARARRLNDGVLACFPLMETQQKVIVHIDMDAFFAAVEQRDRPALQGKPVVIGADPRLGSGRGVVSTCSYEARRYGIHSAMPISIAYRKCPQAVFLPVAMEKYAAVSDEVFTLLHDFTPDIEPVSIDEAFLDITGSYHFFKTPRNTCLAIKERIKSELHLTASIGIAPIKMAAKIASDLCKPDGLLEITKDAMLDFLWPLPVEKLWGVGPKSKAALHAIGITTIGELARVPAATLRKKFGEAGRHLFELAHGIDERVVAPDDAVKSVSNEHTFGRDTADKEKMYEAMLHLSEKVSRRLRQAQLKGKTLTVKIRLQGFQTHTRAVTFAERTNFADTIYQKSRKLFDDFYAPWMKIRLIGVKISNFNEPYVRESLFSDVRTEKKEQVHHAIDAIKDKFGEGAIARGARCAHGARKDID